VDGTGAAGGLTILASSATALVLDKPAGLPLDPGRRGGPSLADLLPALARGRFVPQPAHRLDQDTAGCLVVGLSRAAVAELGRLFAAREVAKTYWAVLCDGPIHRSGDAACADRILPDQGTLDAPLAKRSTRADGWRMVVAPDGQPARTAWRVLGRGPGLAWVEFRPQTGRTHQLRAHAAHLGAPILGDARYGGGAGAMHLLARHIALPGLEATAPVPAHMQEAIAACGG
jgi:tRNA pseudouridine32 synthase / 23S rRNA pseudouridine746 synthase